MRYLLAAALIALSSAAWADPPSQLAQAGGSSDTEFVRSNDPGWVSLRDFLSLRIDQLRNELIERIDQATALTAKISDERDHQYGQRFDAQQSAINAALVAAKEAVANALSAAKEAVTKAEDSANKRFESVNEFRNTLTDQQITFATKDVVNTRFDSVERNVAAIEQRLAEIKAVGEGASNLWGYLIGALGAVLLIITFVMQLPKRPTSRT